MPNVFETYPIPVTAILDGGIMGLTGGATEWSYGDTVLVYKNTPTMSSGYHGTPTGDLAYREDGITAPEVSKQDGMMSLLHLPPGRYSVLLCPTPSSPDWYLYPNLTNLVNGPPARVSDLFQGADEDLSGANTTDLTLTYTPTDSMIEARYNRMLDLEFAPSILGYHATLDATGPKIVLNSTYGLSQATLAANHATDLFHSGDSIRVWYNCYPGSE